MIRFRRMIILGVLLAASSSVYGQASGELSFPSARSVGLEPAWSRVVSTGYGGGISGVTVHVSPTRSYRGSEVVDKYGRRVFFSERDPGRQPSRSGYDQTSRLTELKVAELAARGLDPQSSETEVAEVTLYVRSTLGTVVALDAETGAIKWKSQAGTAGYPSYGVAASDEHVATLSSTSLYLLDALNGQIVDTTKLPNLPGGTPTLDGNLIYLPAAKGLVEVYSTDDLRRPQFTLGCSGRIDTSITVSPTTASWSTDAGYIYVANAGRPGIIYRFQSLDTMVAAPVYASGTLFATALDGFVYALDETTGDVKWRHSAGGAIREAPLVIDEIVYVTTVDGQMAALDAESGKLRWSAKSIDRFAAVSDAKVYCVGAGHRLTVLDKMTGQTLGSTSISRMDFPVINTKTDRVYLVSRSGVLQCLREPSRRWPITRKPPVPEEPIETEQPAEDTAAPSEEPAPSAQDEPVAAPIDEADPFGSFDAEDAPEAADPFDDPFNTGGLDTDADDGGIDSAEDSSDPIDDPF